MNFQTLAPFIASVIRHALVAGGAIELSKADDASSQIASGIATALGIAWSLYNANKNKQSKTDDSKH